MTISQLKKDIEAVANGENWVDFETETLVIALGKPNTQLLNDQINLLRVVALHPTLFYEDVLFFIYATEVINGTPIHSEVFPHINSLEMAAAIFDMARTLGTQLHECPPFSKDLQIFITAMLKNEGYSEAVPPFDVVGITGLIPGQTQQDTLDKKKAIETYVKSIYN